jgi:hypothetical protein
MEPLLAQRSDWANKDLLNAYEAKTGTLPSVRTLQDYLKRK